MNRSRIAILIGVVLVIGAVAGAWAWATAGQESTDDAQVDAHVTPIAARVGGTVLKTHVADNQPVEAGAVLVEIDPRDYEIALERARADLADAEAVALAATVGVPIAEATTSSGVASAHSAVSQAQAGIEDAQKMIEAATARLTTAQARLKETEIAVTRTAKDVERVRGLLAKDEIAQQQYDATVAMADGARAASDAARSQVREAEAGIRSAESRLTQMRSGEQQANASLKAAETAPQQVAASRARAGSAAARVEQARAMVQQAERNLEYATVKAPIAGIVSRKAVEPGQVVPAGQSLLAIVALDRVWVTANFKETQVAQMRAGQPVSIAVDAYGGREFTGHVESVSPATGARFSLLPANNATGNYVKVVQRLPVKIVVDGGQDADHVLRPGMSVVPTVRTH